MNNPTIKDIMDIIEPGGDLKFYDNINGENIYISTGIDFACLGVVLLTEEIESAVIRFQGGYFGSFYNEGQIPLAGYEYGCYASSLGKDPENGAIMIHRYIDDLAVYFHFEYDEPASAKGIPSLEDFQHQYDPNKEWAYTDKDEETPVQF